MSNILVVDDDLDICLLLKRFLERQQYHVETKHTAREAIDLLKQQTFELVLIDFRLPDENGIDLLQKIKLLQPKAAVIIITGYSDVKIAVQAIKLGAFEYVTKPLHPDEILATIRNALKKTTVTAPPEHESAITVKRFIQGKSSEAQNLNKHIDLVAPTNMTVVILGETGTGKEHIANTIHNKSPRRKKPFIAIDCGALSKELAGSELFGHEKGAFTGAISTKIGSFELANDGTLFLDEIGNLSYDIQVKLLRVLQERKVTRVGGTKDIHVDVRIIVATNEDLRKAVDEGKFREDLYHRVNEFNLTVSPLRYRPDDIELFADFFLRSANEELGKSIEGFSPEVLDIFRKYPWFGNLRELRNVIKRSVLLSPTPLIGTSCLPHEIIYHRHERFEEPMGNGQIIDLRTTAEQAERAAIIRVLQQTENNKTKAAKVLKIDRKTLYNKLNEYNIDL